MAGYSDWSYNDDFSVVHFISEGNKGKILKRVEFEVTPWENTYNLAFGDIGEYGEIDDAVISNNGDRDKVLATIINIAKSYLNRYPERKIVFSGNTSSRTRLYRIMISMNLTDLSKDFEFHTWGKEGIKPFVKDSRVNTFIITRKN